VHVRRQLTRELLQKGVHRIGVDVRRDQSAGVTGFGAHRAEDIQIVILRLSNRAGPGTDPRPDAGDRAVLSEAGLVLVVAQDALIRMGSADLSQPFGQLFLKVSSAAGSVSG